MSDPRPSYSARADDLLQRLDNYLATGVPDADVMTGMAQALATMTLANEVRRLRTQLNNTEEN